MTRDSIKTWQKQKLASGWGRGDPRAFEILEERRMQRNKQRAQQISAARKQGRDQGMGEAEKLKWRRLAEDNKRRWNIYKRRLTKMTRAREEQRRKKKQAKKSRRRAAAGDAAQHQEL